MDAARDFAHGDSPLQPLNPDWDHAFLELLDTESPRRGRRLVEQLDRRSRPATPHTKSAPG